MDSKIKELRELRRMADELAAEIEAIQDAIKAEMTARIAVRQLPDVSTLHEKGRLPNSPGKAIDKQPQPAGAG